MVPCCYRNDYIGQSKQNLNTIYFCVHSQKLHGSNQASATQCCAVLKLANLKRNRPLSEIG